MTRSHSFICKPLEEILTKCKSTSSDKTLQEIRIKKNLTLDRMHKLIKLMHIPVVVLGFDGTSPLGFPVLRCHEQLYLNR